MEKRKLQSHASIFSVIAVILLVAVVVAGVVIISGVGTTLPLSSHVTTEDLDETVVEVVKDRWVKLTHNKTSPQEKLLRILDISEADDS